VLRHPDQPTGSGRAWAYLILAVGWTWVFWLAAIASGRPFTDPAVVFLFVTGAAGVPGAALLFLFFVEDSAARRDFWRRLIDFRRIGPFAWAVICLLPPLLALGGALLHMLHTGAWPEFLPLRGFLAAPLSLLPFILFVLLFGPLPEEIGWRGYALDPLQIAYGALAAAFILGAVHAAWHLPMFYLEGTHQHTLGAFSAAFWRYMLSTVALSVVMTWLFNATARSTLSAIAIHFTNNLTGELFRLPETAEWYRFGLLAIAAGLIVAATGGRLGRIEQAAR
jgi:uncharacterized protein